jgi:2-(1,2-epoxy-1,2-dihydrophenyl)acetyl-CoA isomerase
MAYTKLKVVSDGAVVVVTLCDPPTRNALGPAMCAELAGALEQIGQGLPAARAMVLTGEGGAFSSGANLEDALALASGDLDLEAIVTRYYNPVARAIRALPCPLVTAVTGPAAGIGAAFAFQGDLIVAAETASFTPAFARIGLVPDGGASWILPRLVGRARAMEMLLLGETLSARRALEWGLINRCVPEAQALPTAMELARKLAVGPASLGLTRRLVLDGLDRDWERQLGAEAAAQGAAGRTADFREGLAAFFEKRPPRFRGG